MPTPDPPEGDPFYLNVPAQPDDPFPDLKYFREHRPLFYYAPLGSWFAFFYAAAHALVHDARQIVWSRNAANRGPITLPVVWAA